MRRLTRMALTAVVMIGLTGALTQPATSAPPVLAQNEAFTIHKVSRVVTYSGETEAAVVMVTFSCDPSATPSATVFVSLSSSVSGVGIYGDSFADGGGPCDNKQHEVYAVLSSHSEDPMFTPLTKREAGTVRVIVTDDRWDEPPGPAPTLIADIPTTVRFVGW